MVQITQFLRRAVQTRPEGVATEFEGRTQTWREFEIRASRLAGALGRLGCVPGDRIGMLALNCDRYLEYFFACAWGGFVFVPINTRLAPPEIAFWLADSGCSALMIDDAFLPILDEFRAHAPDVRNIVRVGDGPAPTGMLAYEDLIASGPAVADAGGSGDDLAGIFYTGGTTGRSKGVMLSHRNIAANLMFCSHAFGLTPESVYIHAAPMFHMADGAATFLVTALGGKHVFLPRFEPGVMIEAIERLRVTATLIVPTMINMIVHHQRIETADTSSLRRIFYGASPMPEAVIRRALKVLPHTGFVQAYGQSEAAPCMTFLTSEYHTTDGPFAGKLKAAGRAAIGCEIAILDANDEKVPPGTVGEICGRGDNVMLGYWKQPEITARTLRNGWLHTGDGGYIDEDGFVYVVDRVKDMIISGGENVYSAEVEQALYQHPDVAECAVIGIPDETWGEAVHAIVRAKPGTAPQAEALIAHCKTQIAHYKCPRGVTSREAPLPLSGAGKILKTELRKPYWEGRTRAVN